MRLIGMIDTTEGHGMREKDDLLRSLHHKGLITKEASLDDILSLNAEDIQPTSPSTSLLQGSRLFPQGTLTVTHGHICIGDQKVTIPSYPVTRDEEEIIQYHPSSELNNPDHDIRKAIDTP